MSRKGLFGPIVSSRSCGPEPCTSTTAGNGPPPFGIASVPGRARSSSPTASSRSLKFASSRTAAAGAGAAAWAGWIMKPTTLPETSMANFATSSAFSKCSGTCTSVAPSCSIDCASPRPVGLPTCAGSDSHTPFSLSAGTALAMSAENSASTCAYSPASRWSSARVAIAAPSIGASCATTRPDSNRPSPSISSSALASSKRMTICDARSAPNRRSIMWTMWSMVSSQDAVRSAALRPAS